MGDSSNIVSWLMSSDEPWVVYKTLVDLAGAGADDPEALYAYQAMQTHPRIIVLLDALDTWPQALPLKRVYDPKDSLWKLQTLADFSLKRDDDRISALA